MTLNFQKYAMKGNEFMHRLETNLANEDRAYAARILRSTFQVLRNHLMFEESLQLLSQLPMAIKAVYVDGWHASAHRKVKTADEFLVEIVQAGGYSAWRNFNNKEDVMVAVRAVMDTMRSYVSSEELAQAVATLPLPIQEMLTSSQLEDL